MRMIPKKQLPAYREDCRAYPVILRNHGIGSAIRHLLFMRAQGFLSDEEVIWWVGAGVLYRHGVLVEDDAYSPYTDQVCPRPDLVKFR